MVNQAVHLFKAEFFKALAHPMRIAILELLQAGEKSVGELQELLKVESSGVSQQLAVLRARNLVDTRKDGTTVYYSLRDPKIGNLLDVARQVFNNHLVDTKAMLELINSP